MVLLHKSFTSEDSRQLPLILQENDITVINLLCKGGGAMLQGACLVLHWEGSWKQQATLYFPKLSMWVMTASRKYAAKVAPGGGR